MSVVGLRPHMISEDNEVQNRVNKYLIRPFIKPRSPQLNGKVERSHRTDQDEFYQLLTYTDDVDLNKKLKAWEQFYNFNRPHASFG